MKRQPLKNEIIKECATLAEQLSELKGRDEKIRKQFAIAFGWNRRDDMNSVYNRRYDEYDQPTWEQIFVKLGRLLEINKRVDIENLVVSMEDWQRMVEKNFEKIFNNKNNPPRI